MNDCNCYLPACVSALAFAIFGTERQIGNEQYIDDIVRAIRLEDDYHTAIWRRRKELPMRYMNAAPIGKMKIKWDKGLRIIRFTDLSNRHTIVIYHFRRRLTNRSIRAIASSMRSSDVAKQQRK